MLLHPSLLSLLLLVLVLLGCPHFVSSTTQPSSTARVPIKINVVSSNAGGAGYNRFANSNFPGVPATPAPAIQTHASPGSLDLSAVHYSISPVPTPPEPFAVPDLFHNPNPTAPGTPLPATPGATSFASSSYPSSDSSSPPADSLSPPTWESLSASCMSLTVDVFSEYFVLCPFHNVTQTSLRTGVTYHLGVFKSMNPARASMVFVGGSNCTRNEPAAAAGMVATQNTAEASLGSPRTVGSSSASFSSSSTDPATTTVVEHPRRSKVYFRCGPTTALTSVTEIVPCSYLLHVTTPLVCHMAVAAAPILYAPVLPFTPPSLAERCAADLREFLGRKAGQKGTEKENARMSQAEFLKYWADAMCNEAFPKAVEPETSTA